MLYLGIVLIIPCLADGTLSTVTNHISNNLTRSITGILCGAGLGLITLTKRGVIMIKYILLVIGVSYFFMVNILYAETKEVTLKAGTVVLLAVDKNVTSKDSSIGDIVPLRVIRPVKVDEIVVIEANNQATGKIAELKKAKGWGVKGEISMTIGSTTAVDDTEVLLSAYQKREGDGRVAGATALGAGLGVLCLPLAPTGFLIKGKEGEIPLGYEIKAYTIEDVKIKVDLESS